VLASSQLTKSQIPLH